MSCLNISRVRHAVRTTEWAKTASGLPSVSNNTISKVSMRKSKSLIAEVTVPEGEDSGQALYKFTQAVKNTNLVYEVRRRRRFESKQDTIKRKRREQVFKKRSEQYGVKRYDELSNGLLSITPFQDMFDDPNDDLFSENGFFASARGMEEEEEKGESDSIAPMMVPDPFTKIMP